jgi:hypothetical protein
MKLKLGQQIGRDLLTANHLDQSVWWVNQKHWAAVSQIIFIALFSSGAQRYLLCLFTNHHVLTFLHSILMYWAPLEMHLHPNLCSDSRNAYKSVRTHTAFWETECLQVILKLFFRDITHFEGRKNPFLYSYLFTITLNTNWVSWVFEKIVYFSSVMPLATGIITRIEPASTLPFSSPYFDNARGITLRIKTSLLWLSHPSMPPHWEEVCQQPINFFPFKNCIL